MSTVTQMADYRPAAATVPTPPSVTVTRTAALALVMAVIDALAPEQRSKVLFTVMRLAEMHPDCDASQEAGEVAARFSSKEGR